MAAVDFTAIPCEQPIRIESLFFGEFLPCTNNIVYAAFEGFKTFLSVFMSVSRVFVR